MKASSGVFAICLMIGMTGTITSEDKIIDLILIKMSSSVFV